MRNLDIGYSGVEVLGDWVLCSFHLDVRQMEARPAEVMVEEVL
jgi:hypothetical protein